jgi:hypothetical protein
MNVPNRGQLKPLCHKGQAANVRDISEANQKLFLTQRRKDAEHAKINSILCAFVALRLGVKFIGWDGTLISRQANR